MSRPLRTKVLAKIREVRYRIRSRKSVFYEIYRKNLWGGRESVSGPGSDLVHTSAIRREIPNIIREIGARSILDAPCGDFYWMKETEIDVARYVGVDIVPELIIRNKQKYANEVREFIIRDITKDSLPQVDMIICRDCLIHFSFRDIIATIRNFKRSKSKYLLTTTAPMLLNNIDIITGHGRPINLELPPFNFPRPVKLISEMNIGKDGRYTDKSLGLWKLDQI